MLARGFGVSSFFSGFRKIEIFVFFFFEKSFKNFRAQNSSSARGFGVSSFFGFRKIENFNFSNFLKFGKSKFSIF